MKKCITFYYIKIVFYDYLGFSVAYYYWLYNSINIFMMFFFRFDSTKTETKIWDGL